MTPQQDSLHKIRQLSRGELSLQARMGYVALLLVSTAMTVIVVSLWSTEPLLPVRTQAAFGAMSVIGIAWMVLSLWALSSRRVLYARDRVIAGGMAVVFTAMFVAGALAAVVIANNPAAYGAAAIGVLMLSLALRAWTSARRRFAQLSAQRDALVRA